ncbi:MAG: class I SAM-dependent methyltransferase [Planctomycetes bacterium]|nr:class I SAM-dependent methyltransferase [Planctomycetota bacterium]
MGQSSAAEHAEYRTRQREQWAISAQAWKRWWARFEEGAGALSKRIVSAAGIEPGMRVLDLCTGLGEPGLRVARAVGSAGRVVGADLARPMLEFARERAAEARLSNISFAEMEGEHLGLAAQAFDAATFRWGPMLMDDPVASLREVRRVLKPGARLGVSVWGTGKEVPFIALAGIVAEEIGGIARPPPGTPGPLRMGRAGELETALADAGFTDVRCEAVEVVMSFTSAAQYVEFTRDASTTLRQKLDQQPEAVRTGVWKELERRAGELAETSGELRLSNRCWCAGARA